jgi:Elongation factor Tu domain 2
MWNGSHHSDLRSPLQRLAFHCTMRVPPPRRFSEIICLNENLVPIDFHRSTLSKLVQGPTLSSAVSISFSESVKKGRLLRSMRPMPFVATIQNPCFSERPREVAVATRKKAKGKAKGKKAPARKKATTVRKPKRIRKKVAKKAPLRRVSAKKARPTAKAVKPTPASPPAPPEAIRPTPSLPGQGAPPEERVGVVTHYYSHLSVAIIRLESGRLRVGDVVRIRGHTTDFSQTVGSLEVNHAPVTQVEPNGDFGLKVVEHAREHDVVFKVRS